MALWQALKTAVSAVITTNGNNEITGQVLRDIVNNNLIPQLGEGKFLGIATPATVPPASPEKEYFYLASEAGIYANFAGAEIPFHGLHSLAWDGAAWVLRRHYEGADRLGVSPLRYPIDLGTAVGAGANGVKPATSPYGDAPVPAVGYTTITYSPADEELILIRATKVFDATTRTVLVVDDQDRIVYLSNSAGDLLLDVRENWTVQATVDATDGGMYKNPLTGSTFDALARKPIGKISWVVAAATPVALPDTFYKLAGTTALSNSYQTSMPGNNELLWEGVTVQNAHVHGSVSVESSNNSQIVLEMRVYDGATLIEILDMPQFTTNGVGKAENEAINDIISEIQAGWHLELWGKNITAAADITVDGQSKYFIYSGD